MNIHIAIHYSTNDNKSLRRGTFPIIKNEVYTAYKWIRQLQMESAYDLILEKVIVDREKDITEEVKKILEAPLI